MRLFRVLPVLSLLFGARASSLQSREPAAHPLDARELLDVCASVNADLVVPDVLNVLTAVGALDICLCLSALPLFLETNIVALLAVDIAGEKVVTDILANLAMRPMRIATTPSIANPHVLTEIPADSPALMASLPFPPSNPTKCVCSAPNVVCNGKWWMRAPPDAPTRLSAKTALPFPVLPTSLVTPVECMVRRCRPGYVVSHDGTSCKSKHAHSHVATPEEEDEYEQAMHYGLEHRPL
ncbi:hypothetical protein EDB87DRAFT_1694447 [Lactarius vividus]|nr:hypothetical protein EDB87DRAFT_1694447 [Lactarius vividus]